MSTLSSSSATINLTYHDGVYAKWDNWAAIKPAIEEARNLWANTLYSKVTIEVEVIVENYALDANPKNDRFLALTTTPKANPQFGFLGDLSYAYPVALYEKINEQNLPNVPYDFKIVFNVGQDWAWNTTPGCVAGFYDLMTTAIHEFAHGFGTSSTMRRSPIDSISIIKGIPAFGGKIAVYDAYIEDLNSITLESLSNNGFDVHSFATLPMRFNGAHCAAANSNSKPRLNAPFPFQPGSSITHFNRSEFASNPNNPDRANYDFNDRGVCFRSVGNAMSGLMFDIGWDLGTSIEEDKSSFDLKVYPNPSAQWLNVYFEKGNGHLTIGDVNGRLVFTDSLKSSESRYFIGDFPSGMYFVNIVHDSGAETVKINIL